MKPSFPGTTVGERRGLIALLIAILIVVGIVALCNHRNYRQEGIEVRGEVETISATEESLQQAQDSINTRNIQTTPVANSKACTRKTRMKETKKAPDKAPVPARSPRDERVN